MKRYVLIGMLMLAYGASAVKEPEFIKIECDRCRGKGQIKAKIPCPECAGTGKYTEWETAPDGERRKRKVDSKRGCPNCVTGKMLATAGKIEGEVTCKKCNGTGELKKAFKYLTKREKREYMKALEEEHGEGVVEVAYKQADVTNFYGISFGLKISDASTIKKFRLKKAIANYFDEIEVRTTPEGYIKTIKCLVSGDDRFAELKAPLETRKTVQRIISMFADRYNVFDKDNMYHGGRGSFSVDSESPVKYFENDMVLIRINPREGFFDVQAKYVGAPPPPPVQPQPGVINQPVADRPPQQTPPRRPAMPVKTISEEELRKLIEVENAHEQEMFERKFGTR